MKYFFVSTFYFLVLFLSVACSDGRTFVQGGTDETLRSLSETRAENTLWTKELEEDVLKKNILRHEKIKSDVELSSESVSVLFQKEYVYPSIEEFGNLDASNVLPAIHSAIKEFVIKFSSGQDVSSFFLENNFFTYIFFMEDISLIFDECFLADIKKEEELFSSFEMARPFIADNMFEVPVRLFCKYGFVDIHIFFDEDENKIAFLEIIKWEAKNGKK